VVAVNYFSLDCLQLSFELLRDHNPSLALLIQNEISTARQQQLINDQDKLIELTMDVVSVSEIVTALSKVAELSADDNSQCSKEMMIKIHQTLLDWLLYAQSFLREVAPLSLTD
jgi:hypothetical protein